ncbi:MAG: 30S ribosomal protein S9 [Planctomycetia bacterium]|nr:30S ribosomal protein S9 [Planctomycetia bacterium]
MTQAVFQGTGRRKRSIARVYLSSGKGNILINNRPFTDYLGRSTLATIVRQPFEAIGDVDGYDVKANVTGGGLTGQAGAIRLGIARALLQINEDFRVPLRQAGFLTRDARKVERKKYGQPGARKRFQYSKR